MWYLKLLFSLILSFFSWLLNFSVHSSGHPLKPSWLCNFYKVKLGQGDLTFSLTVGTSNIQLIPNTYVCRQMCQTFPSAPFVRRQISLVRAWGSHMETFYGEFWWITELFFKAFLYRKLKEMYVKRWCSLNLLVFFTFIVYWFCYHCHNFIYGRV